jgi:[protein-PII] uridylyltransferase
MSSELKAGRQALVDDRSLTRSALRQALTDLYDGWLASALGDPGPGIALVAVGALGRRDPSPGSDLDLVLVHARDDVSALADQLWYPIWDSGVDLDHSVRTVPEAAAVARDDLKAALGLLDARFIAGDEGLGQQLVSATRASWRATAAKRLPELRAFVDERAEQFGEVAFLLEPDLKSARGGMRDVHALHAVAIAQVADVPTEAVRAAYQVLLDVRGELHRRTGGSGRRVVDRLLMQEQDGVAEALGLADADELMAQVSTAARTIAFAADTTWRRVAPPGVARRGGIFRRGPQAGARRPLADDVVEQDGEVVLARDATPAGDPGCRSRQSP